MQQFLQQQYWYCFHIMSQSNSSFEQLFFSFFFSDFFTDQLDFPGFGLVWHLCSLESCVLPSILFLNFVFVFFWIMWMLVTMNKLQHGSCVMHLSCIHFLNLPNEIRLVLVTRFFSKSIYKSYHSALPSVHSF